MVYPIVYVPNKTDDFHLSVFNMITRINESKIIYHANVNVSLLVGNVI